MKTELFAAASLVGLFALSNADDISMPPRQTEVQKQQALVQKTCSRLNDEFMGSRDVYAKKRVEICMMAVTTINALIKK
jgi:hypothetical protein